MGRSPDRLSRKGGLEALGTSVVQLSARTPTACAMASLTIDHLCGGRHILDLGVSGPQVVEGWYGQRFPKPLARTREYIDIVRKQIRLWEASGVTMMVIGARRVEQIREAAVLVRPDSTQQPQTPSHAP